ncbi:hypothetical protein SDJN02_04516 [Cucurbita argyrosperma subsp. argyrosperma]|nr:hypothetical protein SDJN02_04516 [Cucurbita argyrosperma subsp. argyrosperma]
MDGCDGNGSKISRKIPNNRRLAKFRRSSNACIVSASNPPANCGREKAKHNQQQSLFVFLNKND